MNRPFSPACERNREPILVVLREVLRGRRRVLEIGSGTGQHAVYFGRHLPDLLWQTSDLAENHAGINDWLGEEGLANVLPPLVLDMQSPDWPDWSFDSAYSANTTHIMSWPQVEQMMEGVASRLPTGGLFCLYGPFNYAGAFTSESNAMFNVALKSQASHRGIRDIEAIERLATRCGLVLSQDHAMPFNNRLLVLVRQ